MYPKVFLDYMGHRHYGPVRTLPTRTFFTGWNRVRRSRSKSRPHVSEAEAFKGRGRRTGTFGDAKVLFELNGQPRVIRCRNWRNESRRPPPNPRREATSNHTGVDAARSGHRPEGARGHRCCRPPEARITRRSSRRQTAKRQKAPTSTDQGNRRRQARTRLPTGK